MQWKFTASGTPIYSTKKKGRARPGDGFAFVFLAVSLASYNYGTWWPLVILLISLPILYVIGRGIIFLLNLPFLLLTLVWNRIKVKSTKRR